jgi:membrane-bound metal-dependent hydrolase YbcI (DUF457 family)
VPYPVAHMLFAAAVSEACLPRDAPHRNWKVAAGAALGLAPDLDFILVWCLGLGREWHRGFTHSIVFSAAAGAAWFALRGRRQMQECVALTLVLLSHCALDFLTSVRSTGVALFWPFSSERYGFGLIQVLEPQVTASTLREIMSAASRISLVEAAIFAPLFMLVWLVRRGTSLRRNWRRCANPRRLQKGLDL